MHYLLLLASVALFSACGSLTKDAKKLMENGDYQSAVALWDQVIVSEPTNAEAKFYRQMAQSELLNQDLVTLQGLIDSKQTILAFEQLKRYHDKRTQWGLGMNPNSSRYLKQQTERLHVRYLELQQLALQKGYVLKSLWLERTYRPLIDTVPNDDERQLTREVRSLGEKKCRTLESESKSKQLPYLYRYAMVFCRKFGRPILSIERLERAIEDGHTQLKAIKVNIDSITPIEGTVFMSAIQEEVKKLASYSKSGAIPESLLIQGAFSQQIIEKTIPMSHSYQVSIPYTDYEIITHLKSIPYTAFEQHCNTDASSCWSESVTRYRQEEDRESVPVTKLRSEPRVYEFSGLELTNKMTLALEITGQVKAASSKFSFKVPFEQSIEEKLTSHRLNLPDIGLTPKVAVPTDKAEWLKQKSQQLAQHFYETKVNQWTRDQCHPKSTAQKWNYLEQMLHCIQQPEARQLDWIQQAAHDHEGLSVEQISETLGPISER